MIFGKEFIGGSTALAILSVGQIMNAGMGSVVTLSNMTGYEREAAKGVGIAALVNVILNAVLVPFWGLNGAAMATVAGLIIWKLLLVVWVRKKLGIQPTAVGRLNRRNE